MFCISYSLQKMSDRVPDANKVIHVNGVPFNENMLEPYEVCPVILFSPGEYYCINLQCITDQKLIKKLMKDFSLFKSKLGRFYTFKKYKDFLIQIPVQQNFLCVNKQYLDTLLHCGFKLVYKFSKNLRISTEIDNDFFASKSEYKKNPSPSVEFNNDFFNLKWLDDNDYDKFEGSVLKRFGEDKVSTSKKRKIGRSSDETPEKRKR